MPTFLENYRYATAGNEVPPMYHTWCGLSVLSSVVSRRVKIDQGIFPVYPNLYIVFVAEPAGRKSTALGIAERMLLQVKDVPFSSDCCTKEALVEVLVSCERVYTPKATNGQPPTPIAYSPLTLYLTELAEFLTPSKGDMITFLTTLFDKVTPYVRRTRKHGEEKIEGPYLVLVGCCTPDWITSRLRDDIISGGFSRRALFIYESGDGPRITFPEVTKEQESAWDACMEHLRVLKEVNGTFTWSDEARTKYHHWYQTHVIPNDRYIRGYYKSKHIQLLKVAQLVALSESTNLVLEWHHLETGLALLEFNEKNLSRVFEGIGRNELNATATKLLDILRANAGSMFEKKLRSIMYAEASENEYNEVIRHLVDTERIVRTQGQKNGSVVQVIATMEAFTEYERKRKEQPSA